MNRLLTRKRGKDGGDIFSRGKKGKRGSQQQQELDLGSALPSTENFRTSLLLPNLSARFSMLREQDDPTSLLGKASDDSVLQPKRVSRLPDFGYASGLSDIAEVASFNSSVKPPFANQRIGSMTSNEGSATDDGLNGSVMNRSRTREGNTLFGGRQKTFKVAVSSDDERKEESKAIRLEDFGLSAKDKHIDLKDKAVIEKRDQRLEEKDSKPKGTALPDDVALALLKFDDDGSTDFADSPSSEYQGKRATSSTSSLNSSGPSFTRASTAATSVASQGASSIPPSPAFGAVATQASSSLTGSTEKPPTRSKRLYEQSLDQHYHDQQISTLNRLNSIQKQRSVSAKTLPSLGQPKLSGGERSASSAALDRSFGTSPLPPPPMAKLPELNTFDLVNSSSKGTGSNSNKVTLSPIANSATSPFMSPVSPFTDFAENRILTGSLIPNDRGKATALGAFNKPRPFDEQQYLERQMQMQQRTKLPSNTVDGIIEPAHQVAEGESSLETTPKTSIISPQSAVLPLTSPTIPSFPTATCNTRSAGSSTRNTLLQENRVKDDKDEKATEPILTDIQGKEVGTESSISKMSASETQMVPQAQAVDEAVEDTGTDMVASEHTYPLQQATVRSTQEPEQPTPDEPSSPKSVLHRFEADQTREAQPAIDSPTLGPGLSGLVKQHLRNVSNVSSVYSVATAAGMAAIDASYPMPIIDNVKPDTPLQSANELSHINDNDYDGKYQVKPDNTSLACGDEEKDDSNKAQVDVSDDAAKAVVRTSSCAEEETQEPESAMKKTHSRGGSTETQHERKAFANELINRQRQIQENLRNKIQLSSDEGKKDRAANRSESRTGSRIDSKVLEHNGAQSPALGMSAPFKAWSAIKSVGRDSAASTIRDGSSSKNPKAIELSGSSPNASSTSLATTDKLREKQHSALRGPNAVDDAAARLPNLSERQRLPDSQAVNGDEGQRPKPLRDRNIPFRPRGRLPSPEEGDGSKRFNNQRTRGQSEGPKVPRIRRPTIIKAESDGRDRATSESGPTGQPNGWNGNLASSKKHFNAKEPIESAPRKSPLPPKASFPYVRPTAANRPDNIQFKDQSSALDVERATANAPRNAKIRVQTGLNSPKISHMPEKPLNESSPQIKNLPPSTSAANSPVKSPNTSSKPAFSITHTAGLPTGPKSGISPTTQKSGKADQPFGVSGFPISLSPAHETTTPLSMTIKSGTMSPLGRSGSSTPISTAALVPPDMPTVPIRLGAGGPPRKRQVNKNEISVPAFVSSTSTVETVTLEYARQNQSEFPSSIPEISTRRRQPGPFSGAAALSAPQSPLNGQLSPREQYKANESAASSEARPMRRLRQVLSEGHGLYGKARQQQQQQQQRQTLQAQQAHSVPLPPPPPQPLRPEFRSPHLSGGAAVPQRAAMPAAIAVTENGMF